jgi:uncharacterized protein involved in high-affinity Fe2+ transport
MVAQIHVEEEGANGKGAGIWTLQLYTKYSVIKKYVD